MWHTKIILVDMDKSTIKELLYQYPQLALPIKQGTKDTLEYKNAVLQGKLVFRDADFIGSPEDSLSVEETPAGDVEVLCLGNREDFVHALRALAYRCEPVEIPASVGASTVRGLINWEKIRDHKKEYLAAGGNDWNLEFKRFTADKKNYLDTIILLSCGDYSAVPASFVGLKEEAWREKSLTIRKYHELTHFVCRTLYPENIVPIRDEVIADMIGLVAAFGSYDPMLARRFLGIESGQFRDGGRLSHYADKNEIDAAAEYSNDLIDRLVVQIDGLDKSDAFILLLTCFKVFCKR